MNYNIINRMATLTACVASFGREVRKNIPAVRIRPNSIPSMEKKLLCATFLEAVISFYEDPENEKSFKKWCAEKGESTYDPKNG